MIRFSYRFFFGNGVRFIKQKKSPRILLVGFKSYVFSVLNTEKFFLFYQIKTSFDKSG
jgi:hypothetical protein